MTTHTDRPTPSAAIAAIAAGRSTAAPHFLRAQVTQSFKITVLRYPWPPERRPEPVANPEPQPEAPKAVLPKGPPTLREVLRMVEKVTKVGMMDLISPRRACTIVRARTIYYAAAKAVTPKSVPAIGRACGGRDHSTVLHGIRRAAEKRPLYEPELTRVIEALTPKEEAP